MSSPSEHPKTKCTHNGSTNNSKDTVKWLPKENSDIITTYLDNPLWFKDNSNLNKLQYSTKAQKVMYNWTAKKVWNMWTVSTE